MKKLTAMLLLVLLVVSILPMEAMAKVKKDPQLDAAFSMIEKDNIFLRKYNELTGSNVKALYELGVPYFFGGQETYKKSTTEPHILEKNAPNYQPKKPVEPIKGISMKKYYFYGFDCIGYVRWIRHKVGLSSIPSNSDMRLKKLQYHLFNGGTEAKKTLVKTPPPYEKLKDTLKVGDLLVVRHNGSAHILMYIGTLKDYGFTKKNLPELAAYLDYPLVIHTNRNPFYKDRFQKLIDSDPKKYANCEPPVGGVQVSIVGVPVNKAPNETTIVIGKKKYDYYYYYIGEEQYPFTIFDLDACSSFAWYRQP